MITNIFTTKYRAVQSIFTDQNEIFHEETNFTSNFVTIEYIFIIILIPIK